MTLTSLTGCLLESIFAWLAERSCRLDSTGLGVTAWRRSESCDAMRFDADNLVVWDFWVLARLPDRVKPLGLIDA